MIPIKLTLTGFLSYREPVEVDFTSFSLACISGANGSGKSSLLDAMTWAMFGQARARDDAIINTKTAAAEVSFTFHYEGNTYRVVRAKTEGKTTSLEFHIMGADGNWKPLTERTLRATEARINEILRLDYETFVNASFFLQGKADQFTQQRPADRKRILSSILGLEVWEAYRKEAVNRRKDVELEINTVDGRLQEINKELDEEDQRRTRLAEAEASMKTISEALGAQTRLLEELRKKDALLKERGQWVNTLGEQADRTRQDLESLRLRLETRTAEKDTFAGLMGRAQEIEDGLQAWEQSRTELAQWDENSARFNEQEKRRHEPLTEIEKTRSRLEAERDALQEQERQIAALWKALEAETASLTQMQAETQQLEKALSEREDLEAQRQQVLQKQAEAKAENPHLKAEMDELKGRIEQLTSTDGAVCPLCGQPLSSEDRARLIEELNEEGTQKGDQYRANVALLKSVGEQVVELDGALAEYAVVEDKQREVIRRSDQAAAQIAAYEAELDVWEKEGMPRLEALSRQLAEGDFAHDARQTLAAVDEELKEIGYDAVSHDAIRQNVAVLAAAEAEYHQLEKARATLAPLEREIQELGEQIARMQEILAAQEAEYQTASGQLAADQTESPDLLTEERKMLDWQEQENRARMELGAAQQTLNVLDTQKTRKVALEAEREQFSKQVVEYKVLERAFGKNGVPAMLIEQALPQIETSANQLLEKLSGGMMSIRFITQQAYKDSNRDDLRETLDIQITDSTGARDYEMYSGGEAFRINFAIRLALSEVLAQRAGARLQTLVIDEGFGSQDEIGRQRLIEAINTVKDDFEKILVITHIEALKEAFPNRLEVTKGPQGSTVELF